MKYLLTRDIPNFQFKKGIGHIYTIKVSVNGKVNGRNRSINYIFLKNNLNLRHISALFNENNIRCRLFIRIFYL